MIYWVYVEWSAVEVAIRHGFRVPIVIINRQYMGIREN